MEGSSYTITITATLGQVPPLYDSTYSFTLVIDPLTISAPTIASSDIYCYPGCACSISVGQYCIGTYVSTANCETPSFSFSVLVNGTSDASFPMTVSSSSNDVTLSITPTNAYVYEDHEITVYASLVSYPTVTDSSYTFYLHTSLPSIVAPSITSSSIICDALDTCTYAIG
jgi:hypothetical protein